MFEPCFFITTIKSSPLGPLPKNKRLKWVVTAQLVRNTTNQEILPTTDPTHQNLHLPLQLERWAPLLQRIAQMAFSVHFARPTHIGQNDHEIDALSTESFAPPFARLLAPLTHSPALHCSLHSRAPLRSFVRSLTHSLRSSREIGFCLWNERVDFIVSTHCATLC